MLAPTVVIPEFIEAGAHEKGFASHFKAKIAPLLEGVEANRLVQYAAFKKRLGISIPIAVLILLGAIYLEASVGSDEGDFVKIAIFLMVCLFGWAYLPIKRYKDDVKSKFMPVICQFYGNMSYALTGDSPTEKTYSGQIFPSFTSKSQEDFISGEYKQVQVALHESKLRRKSGKSTHTVFRGLVIELDFPKEFKGKTLLRKDGGSLGNWFEGKDFQGLTRVELEDPEFESMFQVFSSDQVEARFVLTTAFMERLLSLARLRSVKTPSVQCAFENKRMVIAIPSSKDLFEPGSIKKSALQIDDIHTFLAEMKEVFELVDVLKLTRV